MSRRTHAVKPFPIKRAREGSAQVERGIGPMTREKALLGHRSAISGQTHQAAMVQQENRPGNLESLLTIDTLMSLLGVSRPTVYTLMEQESLPYIKMGRSLRFRPSAIHTWLLEHEQMR